MLNLEELRSQVNYIDAQIIRLIIQRMMVVRSIVDLKKSRGIPVRDTPRERVIIANVGSITYGECPGSQQVKEKAAKLMGEIFTEIIAASRKLAELSLWG